VKGWDLFEPIVLRVCGGSVKEAFSRDFIDLNGKHLCRFQSSL